MKGGLFPVRVDGCGMQTLQFVPPDSLHSAVAVSPFRILLPKSAIVIILAASYWPKLVLLMRMAFRMVINYTVLVPKLYRPFTWLLC